MQVTGEILELIDGKLKVQVEKHASCKGCGVCASGKGSKIEIKRPVNREFSIGDIITVEVTGKKFLYVALISYGLPVPVLFLGYFIGSLLASSIGLLPDLAGALFAFLFVVIYFIILKIIVRNNNDYEIIQIVKK